MKKLFFVAVLATLALVACKKEDPKTDPVEPKPQQDTAFAQNLIYDQFNELVGLVGMQKSAAEAALTQAGWQDYGGTFIKLSDCSQSQATLTANGTDVVYDVTCAIFPDTTMVGAAKYKPQMYNAYIKDAIKKIGNTFNLGSAQTGCRYYKTFDNLNGGVLAGSPESFCTDVMTDELIDNSTTYYLDNNIGQWFPDNPTTFVGAKISFGYYDLQLQTGIVEFRTAIQFVDENMK